MIIFRAIGYLFIGCFAILGLPMTVMFLWADRFDFNLEGIELFGYIATGVILSVFWMAVLLGYVLGLLS